MALDRSSRRRRGLILGGVGLGLLFGSGLGLRFSPPGLSPLLLVPMVLGILLLVAGFLAVPRNT